MATWGEEGSYSAVHPQGYAVFIVNIEATGQGGNFHFETREGAREDGGSLQVVFSETLGFEWINPTAFWHQNLPLARWDHREGNNEPDWPRDQCCLRCHIQSLDHSRSKCFLLAISSHGQEVTETEIIFSDGKSLCLTKIFDALNDENCPTLKGKPRIIILQACRSSSTDKEQVQKMQDRGCYIQVRVPDDGTDMAAGGNGTEMAAGGNGTDMVAEGNGTEMADCTFQQIALNKMPKNNLLIYPCVSGQRSQRSENYGSWLIFGLKDLLLSKYITADSSPRKINFLHLLTDVAGYIARERETIAFEHESNCDTQGKKKIKRDEEGKKIVDKVKSGLKNAVCIHHTLVEPLIFYPKVKDEVELALPSITGKKKSKKRVTLE